MRRRALPGIGLVALIAMVAVTLHGCGLGYIEIVPESTISFRIENAAPDVAEVSINVTAGDSSSPATLKMAPMSRTGEQSAATPDAGKELPEGQTIDPTTAQLRSPVSNAVVRVASGNVSSGTLLCGEEITVSAVVGSGSSTAVELTGAGTGTPGFDSGSIGTSGDRFLIHQVDFACGDAVLIKILAVDRAELEVIAAGSPLPAPVTGGVDMPDEEETPTTDLAKVTFRLENATATPADISISAQSSSGDAGQEEGSNQTSVRVPAGQFSFGEITCGGTFVVDGTIEDGTDSKILFTGAGTGTPGFDDASIGFDGERILLFEDHYQCGQSIVVRITDDGTGIGASTSNTPLGSVNVFAAGEPLPAPDLPDPEQPDDEEEETAAVTLRVVNQTESTIQVNFATGNGSLAISGGSEVSSEFDVRVAPLGASEGVKSCAQEYIIAAAHLQPQDSTYSTGGGTIFDSGGGIIYHAVVLTGDGTGTAGFDEESLAIVRGRLLQLGTHFNCGDTITVTVERTNNQLKVDEEGAIVTDEFGNPEIQYNVGEGTLTVTPATAE
ncbi:MAG: hypothetical protein JSV78_09900 [Phycisphaerales bacterium]|nr:MAG: hypothetical protein JSV78_09900 [Phycisphaerales bacterium]